jgi:putative FmdB family regulatory protein
MPLYEYECFVCGVRFERIQRFSEDPVQQCPACGGAVRRLLGVPALQFKGSGWYVTDYGKGGGANGGGEAPKPASAEGKPAASAATDTPKPSPSNGTGPAGT